ncbi:MAG: exosortase system-associated protein, TIGR04073 family [Gammaproteobacteria bacterium]|nr:exosortase system-associated protein, TIGR04073 family [Gammaproteobacteria bacterium]
MLNETAVAVPEPPPPQPDYAQVVGRKLASGFSNMAMGIAEIPKNMIITTNQTNLLFGLTGGALKGLLHTLGRTFSGMVDVVTFPVPTQPITRPPLVWQDFQTETQYGPVFQRP